ncbi:ShlB/FhaC/HecB family hemolysin secretion/activation protein [Sphingomonas sp.]|uniref:ShlB/FhaC/HecB family hemolysin secretion/activation protein n=1 Tax=Sphingomonas sp. TaxID=28214 RepID=UPI0035BC1B7B
MSPAPAPAPQLPSRAQVEQPAPPTTDSATPRVSGSNAVPTPPCPLAASPLKVTLTGVKFVAVGRDAVPEPIAEALAAIGPPQTGEQPLAVVCTIRDAANAAMVRAGFVASVQVPPQEITDGVLTLSVVLARITEVRVHGEAGRYRTILADAIERLRALDPLNERDAERLLLLVGDVPGLDIQLALRPAGGAPGDVIGDLNVVTQRVSVLANVQNYGSRQLGRETAYARIDINALFVPGDTLYIGGSTTAQLREQQVAQIGYRAGDAASGLSAGPRLTYAWSRPDIGTLDLRSRSIIGGFDVTKPIVRTVRRNLSATIGFEAIEQQIRIYDEFGYSPLNLDRLRVVYTRFDGRISARRFDGLDAYAINGALELRKGLGILDATKRGQSAANYAPSRPEGDPKAIIVRGQLAALGRVNKTISFAHNVLGQWSNHPLLNFDEQALGNLTVGLGYDPGANSADRFVGVHSETRLDFHATRGVDLQLYGFGDNVYIWNLDSAQKQNEDKRHLRSVGGGLRARLPGPMLLEATYARPLDRALSVDRKRAPGRFLLSLTAQISPKFP